MKSIVVYFSRGDEEYGVGNVSPGNTELLAKEIINQTGADEFKIVPVKKYPKGYMDCVNAAAKERNENSHPEYEGDVDLKDYDTIYLGYPIWWGDLPMIVYSFLENHDLKGKTIIPFNTHEGSGNSGTYERLKEKFPDSHIKGDGFNLTGTESRTDAAEAKITAWLATIK